MFPKNYSFELIFSAVVTIAVILVVIRVYLNIVNKGSGLTKPDWMSDSEFEEKFGKKKK